MFASGKHLARGAKKHKQAKPVKDDELMKCAKENGWDSPRRKGVQIDADYLMYLLNKKGKSIRWLSEQIGAANPIIWKATQDGRIPEKWGSKIADALNVDVNKLKVEPQEVAEQVTIEMEDEKAEREKNMNSVNLIGRITKDIELRYTTSQMAVCTFNIAVDRPTKGEEKKTDFPRVTVFGKQAENCDKFLKKGSCVGVQGRIQTGSYKNKAGDTVYTTDIIANNVDFLDSKQKQEVPDGFAAVDESEIPF